MPDFIVQCWYISSMEITLSTPSKAVLSNPVEFLQQFTSSFSLGIVIFQTSTSALNYQPFMATYGKKASNQGESVKITSLSGTQIMSVLCSKVRCLPILLHNLHTIKFLHATTPDKQHFDVNCEMHHILFLFIYKHLEIFNVTTW